jgi:hypothetical protein
VEGQAEMASQLIQYLRLMVEAYLFDGAQQNDEECEPFSLLIEPTTVLDAFIELMQHLEKRKQRDSKLRSLIMESTRNTARQLNEAILLDVNYLKSEDDKLLRECMELVFPEPTRTDVKTFAEIEAVISENQREKLELEYALAELLEIDVSEVPRLLVEEQARKQDVEVLLVKYLLIRIASCRKSELHQDMLKLKNLHDESRYGLKRTVREALLCRVFGLDQAAASLCGAAVEHELSQKLRSMNLIEKSDRFYYDRSQNKVDFGDMIQIALENSAFSTDGEKNLELFRKANSILSLRNNAMHRPDEFNKALKADPRSQGFVLNTREVLEAIQVAA